MILNLPRLLIAFRKDFRAIQRWKRCRFGLVFSDNLLLRLKWDVNGVMCQVKQKRLLPA